MKDEGRRMKDRTLWSAVTGHRFAVRCASPQSFAQGPSREAGYELRAARSGTRVAGGGREVARDAGAKTVVARDAGAVSAASSGLAPTPGVCSRNIGGRVLHPPL
jgi:hypothetical protein